LLEQEVPTLCSSRWRDILHKLLCQSSLFNLLVVRILIHMKGLCWKNILIQSLAHNKLLQSDTNMRHRLLVLVRCACSCDEFKTSAKYFEIYSSFIMFLSFLLLNLTTLYCVCVSFSQLLLYYHWERGHLRLVLKGYWSLATSGDTPPTPWPL
jgi:hypothetical protein